MPNYLNIRPGAGNESNEVTDQLLLEVVRTLLQLLIEEPVDTGSLEP
jgi:hypothetical protein